MDNKKNKCERKVLEIPRKQSKRKGVRGKAEESIGSERKVILNYSWCARGYH